MSASDKPDPDAVPATVEAETATATAAPAISPSTSGSIEVDLASSFAKLPAAHDDGAVSEPAPVHDSAPVSSGRITAMTAAVATAPTEVEPAGKRIADAGKELLGKGVETLGAGIETIGTGVTKLAEVSKNVPLVGSGVAKLGESLTTVGESLHDLPRVARTRSGGLLVRSTLVGFAIVFCWIAAIAILQRQRIDAPDFRPIAESILAEISKGRAAIEELYEHSSPRFQEMVRRDQFVDDMLDLNLTAGPFVEITAINESYVTRGPTGRVGRATLTVRYAKGLTRASVSVHWVDGEWKLLGVGVEVPADVVTTYAQREERVAACKDPMDDQRCDVHIAANHILEQLRDRHASEVWDGASDVFKQQEQKTRWVQIISEQQVVLGEYRRIIAVTEAKVIGNVRGTFDVLVEYSKANVRVIFGFVRAAKGEPWKLRSLKLALPMPRLEDVVNGISADGTKAPK